MTNPTPSVVPVYRPVLVCGPESSGTRLVARIVATDPALTVHHASVPHARDWWYFRTLAGLAHHVVVVTRDVHCTAASAARVHAHTYEAALARWQVAVNLLAAHLPPPAALWLTYEHFVYEPDATVALLGGHLSADLHVPEPVYDGNAPHHPPATSA